MHRQPRVKRALCRAIEFELNNPGVHADHMEYLALVIGSREYDRMEMERKIADKKRRQVYE